MSNGEQVTYFAETDFRNRRTRFGIKNKDRSRHVYVIGKTGMGKSTLLENMAAQDILNGEGMCFMDPHGSAIDVLIDYIPEHRVKDVVYFAPFDTDYPMSFNVLEAVDPDKRHLVVAGLMASFKKIWVDAFSARMEYILSNTLLALLEYPNATLLGVNRMLAEKDFRDDVIKHITDPSVKAFWIDEYNKWDPRYAREAGAAIQNKIGQFTANPLIRNIVGQQESAIDFRKIMDEQKILLVNLSKGLIGESNGNLLGGMLITKLYLAAMSRADVGAGRLDDLPNFFMFVDEFQNFANESFADILSEARKYKLNLTVAHQYVEQMDENVAAAIFGNVGTMVTFRIGATDAEVFEKQFAPTFTAEDLVNLGKFQIYLSLMIDGIGSRPFSARTMPPVEKPGESLREAVIEHSRRIYAMPRAEVEAAVMAWHEPIKKPERRSFKPEADQRSDKQDFLEKRILSAPRKERDAGSSSLKKAAKELDEKEAEYEMKKIVSPRLNDLLDKFGSDTEDHPKNKVIPKVVENIKRHDISSEPLAKTGTRETGTQTTIPASVAEKVARVSKSKPGSDRGAKEGTMSSLQAVLKKAMGNADKKAPSKIAVRVNDTIDESEKKRPPRKVTDDMKQGGSQAETTEDTPLKEGTKPAHHDENTTTTKKEPNTENKPSNKGGSVREVPEDVLKGIFS
ncbi:type IV secretion system DNA-binding domain-containing protein [Patescibacteria group bacterium]|nr:type IV secretion system DNA-binding domain-containing protein [Patescibacteria group bacterium]